MAEVLEQLIIEVIAKDDQAKASLEKFLKDATTYAERLRSGLRDALNLPNVSGGGLDKLERGLRGAASAADPLSARIQRIGERIGSLNAQFNAGFISEEQFRRGLEALQQGLERTRNQADLSQKNLKDLATNAIAVNRAFEGLEKAGSDAAALGQQIDKLARTSLNLRSAYQAGLVSQDEFREGMEEVLTEARALGDGLDLASAEYGKIARAARTAQASLDLDEGRLPKLGLAANVAAANTRVLSDALQSMGPAGRAASVIITRLGDDFTKASTAASGSALGIQAFAKTASTLPALIGASLVAAAGVGVAALVRLGDRFAEVADTIDKGSRAIGISAETFQELAFVMDQNGVTVEQFRLGVGLLNQRLGEAARGNKTYADAFQSIGVSVRNAQGDLRTTESVLEDTLDALARIPDAATQASAGNRIFGDDFARYVIPALQGGAEAMDALRERARELGLVMSGDAIRALVAYKDNAAQLRQQVQVLGAELTADFIPILNQVLIPLIRDTIVPQFRAWATALGDALDAMDDPNWQNNALLSGMANVAANVLAVVNTIKLAQAELNILNAQAQLTAIEARDTLRGPFTPGSPAQPGGGGRGGRTDDLRDELAANRAAADEARAALGNLDEEVASLFASFGQAAGAATAFATGTSTAAGSLDATTATARTAADVLKDYSATLDAIQRQAGIFEGFDADTASLTAARTALVELTRLAGDNSTAIRAIRADYEALGGTAQDLAAALDLARQAEIDLARAFAGKITLQAELGFIEPEAAREQLEAAITRLEGDIATFEGIDLSIGTNLADLDALRQRLGLARDALDAINQVSLDPARANFAKLTSDIDTGRQSLEGVASQLDTLASGLQDKIADLERNGITTLELQPYLDATGLLAQVQDALAGIQSAVLDRDLLEVRMGLRPQDDLERDLRARLDAAQAQLDTFNPTIPLDLDLSSLEGVRAAVDAASADTFLALEAEVEGLTAALDALREARSQTQQAFNERLVLGVDVGAVDASTAQGILEAQLESLRADLQRKIESVDLTVEGAIDPQLAADIDTLAAEVEALEGLLDRVFGRPIPVPQGTAEITDDYRAVRAAAEDAERGLATLQARAVVGGESLDYSSEAASILRAALVKLKADGIDPTTAGYADLEAQLESFTRAQEQQEEALRNAQRAVSNFLAPLSVAARGALEPLGELASAYGDVAKLTGQTETPLERLTATLERLAAGNNLAAFGARRLLAELDRFNVGNDPILDRVRATQRFTEAQFELGRITRSQALASLTELQAELSGLTASFEDSPERAQALADAMLALTASIDGLTVNAGGLAALSEQFAGLQGEVSALGVESGTVFDQMRRKLAEFTAGFEGADLLSLGFDLRPLREDINTLELDDLTRGVEALGLQGASAFDTMRDRLEAFAARVPNSRAEVDALLEELRGFEQLDASDKLADLITQIEQLERDDTQFDTLRTNLREIGTEAGLTEEQIEALLERIAALERASALEAFNQSTSSFLQAAGVAVGTFDDLRDAAQAAFDVGAIGAERFERRLAAIGVLELGEDIRQLAAEFDGAFSLAAEALASTADGIAVIIDAGGELEGTLRGVAVAASGIAQALPEQNGLASQFLEAGAALGGMIAEIAGATPGVGQLVAAVGDLFTRLLGDISGGIAEIEQQVRDTASRFPLLGEALVQGIADANTKTVNAGGLYGLLGGTTQDLDEAAFDAGVSLANNLAQGLADAFSADTLEEFRERFTESLNNTILEAAINAAVLDASLQEQIAELAAAITAAFANDGRLDPEEIAAINAKRDALIQAGEEVYNELSKLPFFGSDGETLTVDVQAPDLGSTFNLPDRIIATPNVTPMVDLTTSQQDLAKVMRESVGVQRALVDAFQAGLPLRVENADGTTSRAVLDAVSIFGRA